MREITAAAITDCVRRLCLQANRRLPADAEAALPAAAEAEPWPVASGILGELCANLDAARETELPICQDTGLVTVFAELGEDAHVSGFEEAVQEGVRRGYAEGYLRKSVVTRSAAATPATTPRPPYISASCRGTDCASPSPPRARAARTCAP